jgi:pyruvate formate lyase activating enzyme
LKCIWCHNPEGISFQPQLAYYDHKCIGCGECVSICPAAAHSVIDGSHRFDREKCVGCGECQKGCLGGALTFYGRDMTVEQIMAIVMEDREFFRDSGGGLTVSGGECLVHYEFVSELLKKAKEWGINTATDTCGYVKREAIDAVIPYTDVFLYDVKAYDEDVHIRCTGHSNKIILENLRYIDSMGKPIEVRIPYVPGYNDTQMEKIAELLSELHNLVAVRVLPYHNYAGSKYTSLDMENTLPEILPTDEEMTLARGIFEQRGIRVKT